MAGGQGHDVALGVQRLDHHPVTLGDLGVGDRQLERALLERAEQLARAEHADLELDAGRPRDEALELGAEPGRPDRPEHGHAQRDAAQGAVVLGDVDDGVAELGERAQAREQDLAEGGELGPAAVAVEQRAVELGLELLDRFGQGGLRDVAALGRAREVAGVDDGQEVADLVQLHRSAEYGPSDLLRIQT